MTTVSRLTKARSPSTSRGDAAEVISENAVTCPALAQPLGVDRGVGRIKASVADQHDGHAVERAEPARAGWMSPIEAVSSVRSHGAARGPRHEQHGRREQTPSAAATDSNQP